MSLQRKLLRKQQRAARKVCPRRGGEPADETSDGWFDTLLDEEPRYCPHCGEKLVLIHPGEYSE